MCIWVWVPGWGFGEVGVWSVLVVRHAGRRAGLRVKGQRLV